MREVAARIRDHVDELAELEAREVGKPRRDAQRFDVSFSHAGFDYFAGLADTLHGEILDQGPIEARVIYEPYGVVAAILPFNWPPIHFAKKCAPALAAGNTVVIKPGEQAPLTVLRLVEIANQVLPPGVINAVAGIEAGARARRPPAASSGSRFTGSTATGRRVLETAAAEPHLRDHGARRQERAAWCSRTPTSTWRSTSRSRACSTTRARPAPRPRASSSTTRSTTSSCERFAAATERLVVGDRLDPDTDIGPMVDARQRDRVLDYLGSGSTRAPRMVDPGRRSPTTSGSRDGYWVAPTVLADVRPEMRIAQEEIFGPIACLIRGSRRGRGGRRSPTAPSTG